MIEVEIKLPLHRKAATERDLISLGFIPGHLIRESDTYFTSDFHDFMKRDEALRIRESENMTTRESNAVLTFKGPKLDAISMTRKELETGVEDPAICRDILLSLGYQMLAPVNKLRQYYTKEQMHACVDQVEGLGSFLELEILVPAEEGNEDTAREEALHQIEDILEQLGYSMAETTRFSYLSMLLSSRFTI